MATDDETNLTVRATARVRRQIEQVVQTATKEGLLVQGHANPVRVKASHVSRLALEAGLPLVLAHLRAQSKRSRPR